MVLSDGVCAIIITLLVLEVHVPEELHRGESLLSELGAIRPSIVAFLISFVVVAIAWVGHRDLFTVIRRTDRTLVWLNILYLLPLCLLPFGASSIARYPKDAVALRMCGLMLIAISATRIGIWIYATCSTTRRILSSGGRGSPSLSVALGPAAAYAVAFGIADVAPTVSLVIYGAVPILYLLAITFARSTAPPGSAEGDLT